MLKITSLNQTCQACPSQWDAFTADGVEVYLRYRWGGLTATVGGPGGEYIYDQNIGDGLDGYMTTKEMMTALAGVLDFSAVKNGEDIGASQADE